MSSKHLIIILLFLCFKVDTPAQTIPSPKQHFGFSIGDNYKLATYTQTEAYFKKVAASSSRVRLVDIGPTEEGRTQYMLVVSSPENLKKMARYKEIAQKLARADQLSAASAEALAIEGKAVVWIDGGLHATETVGSHQLIETLWQLVSRNDRETLRILDEVIVLLVHANPDGQELVANWYMSNPDTLKRSYAQLPKLYQKYVGHDNNRDFYMMNMKETQNISKQLYIEWMPQIIYNHHQAGPAGSVVAGPPYRDPFNYLFNPLVMTGIDAVGASMINRLNVEGKPGYTERGGSVFSTWYNGGLRTTAYFHNMIGLLTEIIGNPTPSAVPLVPSRLLPSGNTPFPVMPQKWNFRKSIDYSISLNYAVLDYAARNREHLLYNIYCMGNSSIQAGNKDTRTLLPGRIDALTNAYKNDQKSRKSSDSSSTSMRERSDTIPAKYFQLLLKDSLQRDPRGYILPSDQPDFPTAVRFINALIQSGINVNKATAGFSVDGKSYPVGTFIVKTNQAFRPHVLDMFEPQDHPNDFLYPGGPPVKPYDIAGWTPAFSMGIKFQRILHAFDGPFQPIPYGELQIPSGIVNFSPSAAGYVLDSRCDQSFVAVNDLLKAGLHVYRFKNEAGNKLATGEGSFYVPAGSKAKQMLLKASVDLSLKVSSVDKKPSRLSGRIAPLRIGLWDMYGGSIASGWLRWMLEQHHYKFDVVYAKEINSGNIRKKYDVLIFVGGAIPSLAASEQTSSRDTTKITDIPAEYRYQWGKITADTSIVALKKFLEEGGTIAAIGRSTNLAYHLKLGIANSLVEMMKGKEIPLSSDKFYIPGSILRVRMDSTLSTVWGMGSRADVFFDSSPVFSLTPEAVSRGEIKPIAWFDSAQPLRSGWAYGQEYLLNGVAAFEAKVGKGKLCAFGPEITFRGQTYSTFKLLFNNFYSGY